MAATNSCYSFTMYSYSTFLLLSVLAVFSGSNCFVQHVGPCPCKDPTHCNFITKTPEKELFVFQASDQYWTDYDWSYITTVATFTPYNPEVMCTAHSKGARLVMAEDYPGNQLSNATYRSAWVKQKVELATKQHMDGINIDFESVLSLKNSHLLIALVNETAHAFRAANPHTQITFDVPYGPGCTWSRCYDYKKLAAICDFLVIMDYDMVGGFPYAVSNDGLKLVRLGIESFQADGIPNNKLVTAVPWYGYDFTCTHLLQDNICSFIGQQDGVKTKNGVQMYGKGVQRQYKLITQLLKNSTTGRIFNETLGSPFFNYVDPTTGGIRQLWYDDPESLMIRYSYAKSNQLRGVSMWNADFLDYTGDPVGRALTKAMWDAINSFFL
ncbi:di-N-acetylchitobiase-like [Asterias rubens]|uniref:di-N-acetylchitobiase-like n=1 Tax=Asterias rubens TaxID=7604 RepID=UPI00145510C3|nr:di-N-acetylchitobiase-like [Asterias rubens]